MTSVDFHHLLTVGVALMLAVLVVTLAAGVFGYLFVFKRDADDAENPHAGSPAMTLQSMAPREGASN